MEDIGLPPQRPTGTWYSSKQHLTCRQPCQFLNLLPVHLGGLSSLHTALTLLHSQPRSKCKAGRVLW